MAKLFFWGQLGIIGFGALSVLAALAVAFALWRIADAKVEHTTNPSDRAQRLVRRWVLVAVIGALASITCALLAVANYQWCVGEC